MKTLFLLNIMLHIPKNNDYLQILTNEEAKDFVATNFSEYFKSIREENLRKIANSLYIFLTTSNEVEKYFNQILLIIVYNTVMLRF